MASTILSSIGEPVVYQNSLATVTENWIVVRTEGDKSQVLLAIDTISEILVVKSRSLPPLASGFGCLILAYAAASSKHPTNAAVPFAVTGAILLVVGQAARRAALTLITDSDSVSTPYGRPFEMASLVILLRARKSGGAGGKRSIANPFQRAWDYLRLLI